ITATTPSTVFANAGGSIYQTSDSPILTNSLKLTATNAIGTATQPINATITATNGTPGPLSATSGAGGINIKLNSGATLGALSADQVAAISAALHLTAIDGANANALVLVTSFENLVNRNLVDYSKLLARGLVQNSALTLDAAGVTVYRPFAATAFGIANPTD